MNWGLSTFISSQRNVHTKPHHSHPSLTHSWNYAAQIVTALQLQQFWRHQHNSLLLNRGRERKFSYFMFFFLYQVFYFRPPYSKRRKAPCIFISFLLQVYCKVYCKTLSQLTVSIVRVSENVLFLLCVVLEADNFVSGQKCPQKLKIYHT